MQLPAQVDVVGRRLRRLYFDAAVKKWGSGDVLWAWMDKFHAVRRRKRKALFEKQNGKCFFCERSCRLVDYDSKSRPRGLDATLDHIISMARGGRDSPRNLVMACAHCNREKGDLDADYFMALRRDPLRWAGRLGERAAIRSYADQGKMKRRDERVQRRLLVAAFLSLYSEDLRATFDEVALNLSLEAEVLHPLADRTAVVVVQPTDVEVD